MEWRITMKFKSLAEYWPHYGYGHVWAEILLQRWFMSCSRAKYTVYSLRSLSVGFALSLCFFCSGVNRPSAKCSEKTHGKFLGHTGGSFMKAPLILWRFFYPTGPIRNVFKLNAYWYLKQRKMVNIFWSWENLYCECFCVKIKWEISIETILRSRCLSNVGCVGSREGKGELLVRLRNCAPILPI